MCARLVSRRFPAAVAALLLLAAPAAASAQRAGDLRGPSFPRQVFSINPLGLAAGLYTGEYELAIDRQMSVGMTASYVDFGDQDFTTVDGRWRIYPSRVLEGVAFGLSAGFGRTRDNDDDADGEVESAAWGLTIGSTIDYQWILGDENRFAFGTGLGFKRFISRADRDGNGPRVWPTFRLSVGAAF